MTLDGVRVMKKFSKISLLLCAGLVAGCSVKVPVKGLSSINEDWVGQFERKYFEMSNGSTTCTGKPENSWSDFTIRIPFECDDGRTGVLKENKAVSGKVTATFSDGTSGVFSMGHGI
jgi:hypothetical protein